MENVVTEYNLDGDQFYVNTYEKYLTVKPIMKEFRKVFTREEWGAEPSKGSKLNEGGPVNRVVFTYRTNTPPCFTKEQCITTMKKIQKNHFKRGMSDIAYNFLVGGDANVYEGRGWGVLPSSFLYHSYGDRVDVAFIGQYDKSNIPDAMFKAGLDVINIGTKNKKIVRQWKILEIFPTAKKKLK